MRLTQSERQRPFPVTAFDLVTMFSLDISTATILLIGCKQLDIVA